MIQLKELIDKYNFNFKKNYGQNFIVDQNILNKIVFSTNIDKETLVIEIGVGAGSLTSLLSDYSMQVIGYEIDEKLKPLINEVLNEKKNVEIIYDDFLKRNILLDLNKYKYSKLYVVANLPYYITTPIITKLINDKINVDKIVIMVQKEVGNRFNSKPGSKEYNSLTIFMHYYYNIRKLFDVSRNVFIPKPNVDSIVIEMTRKEENKKVLDESIFFKLVRDSFKYKRKNLRNNLITYNLNVIEKFLSNYGQDLNVRAEQLTLEQFIEMANEIKLHE